MPFSVPVSVPFPCSVDKTINLTQLVLHHNQRRLQMNQSDFLHQNLDHLTVVYPRGRQRCATPSRSNFFHFHTNILQIIGWRIPPSPSAWYHTVNGGTMVRISSPSNAYSQLCGTEWFGCQVGCQEVGRCHTRGEYQGTCYMYTASKCK